MAEKDLFVISTNTPQNFNPIPTPRANQKIWFVVVDDGDTYYPIKMCLANGDKWGDPVDIGGSSGSSGGGGEGLNTIVLTQSSTATKGNIYYANSLSIISLQLPTSAALGDTFELINSGAGTVRVTQGAGQFVTVGDLSTTTGATGRIDSTTQGDWLEFRYLDRWYCTVKNGFIEVI